MSTTRLKMAIHDLSCGGGGAVTVERALAQVPGVVEVSVNPMTETAYIDGDGDLVNPDDLIAAVTRAGFRADRPTDR